MNNDKSFEIAIFKKKVFINPALMLVLAWILVSFLYLLSLSPRLYFSMDAVITVSLAVVVPALVAHYAVILIRYMLGGKKRTMVLRFSNFELSRVKFVFYTLVALSILEFGVEGYIPLLSKIKGANVSHFDFGIPSVHGLLMAGFLSLSTISILLYQKTKEKIYLCIIGYTFLWAVLIVSRKIFMVGITQWIFVFLTLNNVSLSKFFKVFLIGLIVVIIFGVVGDIRSGAGHIDELGGFASDSVIEMIPGFNWVYLYMTTPLHNLVYATQNAVPEYNLFFNRTLSSLVPSVVLDLISGGNSRYNFAAAASNVGSWFESEAFNVSTAMLQPYIDNGWFGINILMVLLGFVSGVIYSCGKTALAFFSLITISTACVLSIYSDNFTNLNFIGQFIFYFFIFIKIKVNGKLIFS
ncbi:hypothetical protein WN53_17230 [Serratia fonticola]|uniref:O-antigen polymerase n=1 Tax=Serratia fonticola TaxID=47917 RepID=UPI00040A5E09|nr:O-antigen polymerase [Serratia fonticola]AKG70719.1 hypothetical protein WN53_17230 [Serratia fonticola]CAI1872315.1 Uncharacterised protein [Serratia fonticola]